MVLLVLQPIALYFLTFNPTAHHADHVDRLNCLFAPCFQSARMPSQVVVVGGGLSGLSAAHTALQNGLSVVLIDKNAFLGGNSTKVSRMSGAGCDHVSLVIAKSRHCI